MKNNIMLLSIVVVFIVSKSTISAVINTIIVLSCMLSNVCTCSTMMYYTTTFRRMLFYYLLRWETELKKKIKNWSIRSGPSIIFLTGKNLSYMNRGQKIKRGIFVKPSTLINFRVFVKHSERIQSVLETL